MQANPDVAEGTPAQDRQEGPFTVGVDGTVSGLTSNPNDLSVAMGICQRISGYDQVFFSIEPVDGDDGTRRLRFRISPNRG
jgi:hypothetical protein